MKVTTDQIGRLYTFTREHYVEHYDLQTELVDHLANGIEKRWENNPTLSFDDALKAEFEEFGIFGFSDIIDKHATSMSKRYLKIIFHFMCEYIKLPKIIATLAAILGVFYIIRYVSASTWIIGFLFIMTFCYFAFTAYYNNVHYKKKQKKTGKRWKLEEMIYKAGYGGFCLIHLYNILHLSNILKTESIVVQLLLSIVLVFIAVFTYISVNVLPQKAEELLRKTYPEYELSA
ncbi:hypothetical protein [Kordia jejudonensis]|uniref:hypothetical protein n=1 Tax=Kordia jejudonensis TaxID=1348245 RepID=UPI0006296987|nr:hypothetical protein [Kordia jejudonensis]